MTKYLIHAMPKRMWYVEEYLIPSLITQGIEKDHILVYNDDKCEGNLRACMSAFSMVDDDDHGTWHLQDDVCVCKDFKERTEKFDNGLVCGFSSELYDGPGRVGAVSVFDMWFSFPCIRIPNRYARECSEWVTKYIIGNPVYREFWKNGVNDDWSFRMYLQSFHKEDMALNLAPNLVEHVDYLMGGGTGKVREKPCRAQYWEDHDSVKALENAVQKAKGGKK